MSDAAKQKSPLLEQLRRARAIQRIERIGLGEMILKLMRFDAHNAVSKDMNVKHSTAKFHISQEPKP